MVDNKELEQVNFEEKISKAKRAFRKTFKSTNQHLVIQQSFIKQE